MIKIGSEWPAEAAHYANVDHAADVTDRLGNRDGTDVVASCRSVMHIKRKKTLKYSEIQ